YWGGAGSVPAGSWTFISVTYDGTNYRNYVNGSLVDTFPASQSGAIPSCAYDLGIGARGLPGGPNSFWNGLIDEVAIFARQLSSAEVGQLYTNGMGSAAAMATLRLKQPDANSVSLTNLSNQTLTLRIDVARP